MKLSLAITTYNRPEMTIKSFEKVLNDERISEVVIVDDYSIEKNYNKLEQLIESLGSKKIRLYRNESNVGMSLNKFKAIYYCLQDWIIIFDSDNILDTDYLDAFEKECFNNPIGLPTDMIFCPSGAMPKFDYKPLEGLVIDRYNIKEILTGNYAKQAEWLLNTCNYIVNRDTYIDNYKSNHSMIATDTIWHNYNHLKNGGSLHVVPNMTYQHLVWEGSGWRESRRYNKEKAIEVRKLIEQL